MRFRCNTPLISGGAFVRAVCFFILGLSFSLCLTPRVFGQVDQRYEFADEENSPSAAEHLVPPVVGPRYTDRGRILGRIKLTLDGSRELAPHIELPGQNESGEFPVETNVKPRISDYSKRFIPTGEPLQRCESRFEDPSAAPLARRWLVDLGPSKYMYNSPPSEVSEIGRDFGRSAKADYSADGNEGLEDRTDDADEPKDTDDPGGFR